MMKPDEPDQAVDEQAKRISTASDKRKPLSLVDQEARLYPVIRHRSFLDGAKGVKNLVHRPHTAETIILYACDQQEGYYLILRSMLEEAQMSEEELHQHSIKNLRALDIPSRVQQLGDNRITFINPRDGYAASRVLLPDLLDDHLQNKQGPELGIAIPHQDVLIIADLADDRGAQLLARLTFDFASKGEVPICPIPFFYEEGELEPFLIV